MERMIFDKSYNPLKKEEKDGDGPPASDDEDDQEAEKRKAELRARFAAA